MHPEPVLTAIREVHEPLPAHRGPHHTVDPGRARLHPVEHAEPRQHADPGRLDEQAGTDRAGLRRPLEHVHRATRTGQQCGGGQSRGAGAHNTRPLKT